MGPIIPNPSRSCSDGALTFTSSALDVASDAGTAFDGRYLFQLAKAEPRSLHSDGGHDGRRERSRLQRRGLSASDGLVRCKPQLDRPLGVHGRPGRAP
jgi:hypothetical protein